MKLVIPEKLSVQSLGRRAPAQRDIAGEQALQQIQRDVENVRQIKGKRQKQQSWLFAQKVSNEYNAKWKGPDFYHVDDLPPEVVTPGMKVKGRVLSAEVYPDMYRLTMESAIKDAGLIIDDAQFRSEWLAEANSQALATNSAIQSKANKDIQAQIFKDQKTNYNNAEAQEDPGLMLSIVKNMRESGFGSKEELDFLETKAKQTGEVNQYNEWMVAEDLPMIKAAIEFLTKEKSYRKNGGELYDKDRLLQKHRLEREVIRITSGNTAILKAEKQMIAREISIMTKNLLNVKQVDTTQVSNLIKDAIRAGVSAAAIQNLRTAVEFGSANDKQMLFSRHDRGFFADKFIEESNLEDFEKVELRNRLQESHIKQISKGNNDTMQMAHDAGFIKLSPIDANNPRELAMQYRARFQQMNKVQAHYDIYNNDIFSDAEAASESSRFNVIPAGEKIKYLQAITAGLGDDAAIIYEQLGLKGNIGASAVAGIASVYGYPEQSQAILMGGEYLKNNKEEAARIKPVLEHKLRQYMGDAFYHAGGTQSAMKDAVLNAYTHYVIEGGGNLDSGIDNASLEKAMQVTGGIVSYGTSTIQALAWGMTQRETDDWFSRVDPTWVDELGGVSGMSSAKFVQTLKDGDFKVKNEKYGRVYVIRNNGENLENATYGGAFILEYHPDKVTPSERGTSVFVKRRMKELERQKARATQ